MVVRTGVAVRIGVVLGVGVGVVGTPPQPGTKRRRPDTFLSTVSMPLVARTMHGIAVGANTSKIHFFRASVVTTANSMPDVASLRCTTLPTGALPFTRKRCFEYV